MKSSFFQGGYRKTVSRRTLFKGSTRAIQSLAFAAAILGGGTISAIAQQVCPSQPVQGQANAGLTDLFADSRTNLLGDVGGLRPAVEKYGLYLNVFEFDEVFGNASGGIKQGANYDGLTQMCAVLDTKTAFGFEGGTLNVSAFQIRGRNLSTNNLLNLQTYSSIAALPSTRLWEVWYQQSFFGGKFDVKVGQQSLDQEFMTSQGSSLFINALMGWPMLPTADMYGGGPAYPLSSLGLRLRGQVSDAVTVLGGVFQDNPPGGPFNNDPQTLGSSAWGGNFLHAGSTGALLIAEVQYVNPGGADKAFPGTYKLGAWFDTASFPNPRFDTTGGSLAAPTSNGIPQMMPSNFSIYGVMDQTIWHSSTNSNQALSIFVRPMGAPDDRNLIDFSVNGGVTLKAPFQGRNSDTAGLGFGVAEVSDFITGLDADSAFFAGQPLPLRSTETFFEATYQLQAAPWWQLQPDFQYFIRPGGGIPNPNNPIVRIGNEAVFGLRSVITF